MGYGAVIRKIRKENDMSVRQFEKLTGISFSHIALLEKEGSHIGKGTTAPSIALLQQICTRTGYDFRTFLEEAGYIDPVPVVTLNSAQEACADLLPKEQEFIVGYIDDIKQKRLGSKVFSAQADIDISKKS